MYRHVIRKMDVRRESQRGSKKWRGRGREQKKRGGKGEAERESVFLRQSPGV